MPLRRTLWVRGPSPSVAGRRAMFARAHLNDVVGRAQHVKVEVQRVLAHVRAIVDTHVVARPQQANFLSAPPAETDGVDGCARSG